MRSNNSAIKKQKADKRAKKRKEKLNNRLEKRKNPKRDFESMIAYVDKFGNITPEPPAESEAATEKEPRS
jgi:S-adenosylmethionine hydrolase